MFKLDQETNQIMRIFKTIKEKQKVADMLSELTVKVGLEKKSKVLRHYYGTDEPDFVTASCICFGLLNFMEEDFFIVKEVLSYKIVVAFLNGKKKYSEIVSTLN
jgi:hypothetical protein